MQGVHQRTHPHGEEYIFAHIALAAYKLVVKTVSNTNCCIPCISTSNYQVSIYRQLEDSF